MADGLRVFNMKQFFKFLSLCLAVVGLFSGCSKVEPSAGPEVWVTIQPQKFFLDRVADGAVSVEVLVRPGQSPETYAPSASQMARLARADLYFGIGLPVEAKLLGQMAESMPGVTVVALREAHAHEHAHEEEDPHVWLDPVQMIEFVEQIETHLAELMPERADVFRGNAAQLIAELKGLDEALHEQFAPYANHAFYINHPSLGHFAARYGLHQLSIEHAGSAPSARRIAELVGEAKMAKVGAVLTQPEFGQSSAGVLADALGLEVVEINILAEDYFTNMHQIADSLERSFSHE